MNRFSSASLAAATLLATVAAAPAAELYVNASNTTGTELGTQQSPFRTVQAAINAAAAGDTVRVAAGNYVENLRVEGKALVLEGGYSDAWVRDVAANVTTLTGAGGNAVINLIEADATIDGFRITGGTGSIEEQPYGFHGGGIYSRDGSPTIRNNLIENNDVRTGPPPFDYNFGGGVHVSNAPSATIVNNVVRGNFAGRGAGMSVLGQAALIQGNTIEYNVGVGDHGGGLFVGVLNARITGNIIRGNEIGRDLGYGWGGGLIFYGAGAYAEISFNTVYENFAAAYGAGEFIDEGARADIHHELIFRNLTPNPCEAVSAIAVDGGEGGGSQANISHCTVVGNICENSFRGNGLQVEGGSSASVVNSIFWNNGGDDFAVFDTATLTVTYTCSEETMSGTGNVSSDPRFVNAAADDYHLAAGSPCIDAGDPASSFANEPAPNGGRADMGRFGDASDALPGPGTVPSTPAGSTGGGTTNGGSGGSGGSGGGSNGSSGDDHSADGDEGDEVVDSVVGAAVCPSASAMLLSLSILGARRPNRRSPVRPRVNQDGGM